MFNKVSTKTNIVYWCTSLNCHILKSDDAVNTWQKTTTSGEEDEEEEMSNFANHTEPEEDTSSGTYK